MTEFQRQYLGSPVPSGAVFAGRDDFGDTRDRWLAGLCPCCGMGICEWTDGTEPQAIGDGVMICGRCVANQHMRDGFGALLLRAIADPPRGS